jgi:hypothetical protein
METNWTKLYTTSSEHEAHIVRGLLESHGITTMLKSMAVPQFPVTVDGLAERDIYVAQEDYEEGVQLLRDYLEGGEEEEQSPG